MPWGWPSLPVVRAQCCVESSMPAGRLMPKSWLLAAVGVDSKGLLMPKSAQPAALARKTPRIKVTSRRRIGYTPSTVVRKAGQPEKDSLSGTD